MDELADVKNALPAGDPLDPFYKSIVEAFQKGLARREELMIERDQARHAYRELWTSHHALEVGRDEAAVRIAVLRERTRELEEFLEVTPHRINRWIRRRVVVRSLRSGLDFPFDMLRYDNCVPASEEDAGTMARSFSAPLGEGTTVALTRLARIEKDVVVTEDTGRLGQNSRDRWRSKFHWEVVSDEIDERDR